MHSLSRRRARFSSDEDGSIAITMTVILLITMAVVVVLSSVTSGLTLARNDQNRVNAFQHANAGIDQALARIDGDDVPAPGAGGFVQADGAYGFTDTVTATDGSTFEVTAVQTPAGQNRVWTVRSLGTDPAGNRRQAIATISARSLFENGFFTLKDFAVTGSQDDPVAYRSSICLDPRPQPPGCILGTPIDGTLGTNGTLFAGALSKGRLDTYQDRWKGFRFYGHPDVASARNFCAPDSQGVGQCSDAKILTEPEKYPTTPPDPTPAATAHGCLTAAERTGVAIIPAGDYYCGSGLGLTLGPGAITIASTGTVRIWVNGDFGVQPNTYVNQAQKPSRFQVFQPCRPPSPADPDDEDQCDDINPGYSGSVCEQGGAEVQIWGLLFTPGLKVDCSGQGQPFFFGAVVADFYSGSGDQFDFMWDADSAESVHDGKYVVKNWRECPPDDTDC